MGGFKHPNNFKPPPEVPEIEGPDSEEEEEVDSEPDSPLPEPPTPPELRALRSQCEELERDLQGYNANDDTMSQIANKMCQQVENMEREILRIQTKMVEDGMPKAAQGYFPPPGSFRMAVLAGAGPVPATGPAAISTGEGNPSLPRIDNNGATNSGNYTPVAEIARGVQKVVEEIEAAIGISLTSSTGEEVEETEEPAMKKEKMDGDQNRDHQPPTN